MAKKSAHVEYEHPPERNPVVAQIADLLNSKTKDGTKTIEFLSDEDSPVNKIQWVSTGCDLLDIAISNRPDGGLPVGKIVEFYGLEGTGKSLFAAHICASAQKMGGLAFVIDTEYSAPPQFWKAIGVDLVNLSYSRKDTVEDIFNALEDIIAAARKIDNTSPLIIIVDSVAGASTKAEKEASHGKDGFNTSKSIIVSKAMRKITNFIGEQNVLLIFTNQMRMNLQAGSSPFADKWIVPGGKAMAFHSSVRVKLSKTGRILKNGKAVGIKCKARVVKNRLGPPESEVDFEIMYDSGIANKKSWLQYMKDNGIISGDNRGWSFPMKDGSKLKLSTDAFLKRVNEDTDFYKDFYEKICENFVMKYKTPDSEIVEDVEIDESPIDDGDSERPQIVVGEVDV